MRSATATARLEEGKAGGFEGLPLRLWPAANKRWFSSGAAARA